jgi:S-adenosylmethionine-diacylgycerolhomoserine-N-methlytransferase
VNGLSEQTIGHAALMDAIYRNQRHIYDATRKYYLLGRDTMIDRLAVPPGGSVLEVGCGTGRNLIVTGRRFPTARLFGLDISAEMLETARRTIAEYEMGERISLSRADATTFSPKADFTEPGFDRIFMSYTLSMIPDWPKALRQAYFALKPDGQLHIVDFGQQEGLPDWFRRALRHWLALFHVTPRAALESELAELALTTGADFEFGPICRGYAWLAMVCKK